MAREHKDLVLGVKVRVGKSASGDSGIMPLDIASTSPRRPACL